MKKTIFLSILTILLSVQITANAQDTKPDDAELLSQIPAAELQDVKPIEIEEIEPVKPSEYFTKKLEEAKQFQEKAQKENWPLSMRDLTNYNVEIAEKIIGLSQKYQQAEETNKMLEERLSQLRDNFTKTKKRVESMGLTPVIGALLQKRRLALMKFELPKASAVQRRVEIRRVNEEEIWLEGAEDLVESFGEESVDGHLEVMNIGNSTKEATRLAMVKMITEGGELVEELRAANSRYLTILGDQSYAERAIKLEAKEFRDFINVNLLWARSNQSFGMSNASFLGQATARLIDSDNWNTLRSDFIKSLRRDWVKWGVVLLIFVGWLIFRIRRSAFIKAMNSKLEAGRLDSMKATLKGLVMAIVVAGFAPLFIAAVAHLLAGVPGCHAFTKSFTLGLFAFSKILFLAGLALAILHPSGLGQTHFEWPESVCLSLRRFAKWCIMLIAPLTLLLTIINTGLSIPVRGSLGRVIFIFEMIVLALILIPIAKPKGSIFSYLSEQNTSLLLKIKRLCLPLALIIPITFLTIAFLGYYRTGFLLSVDFIETIALIGSMIFLKAFLERWSRVAKHKLTNDEEHVEAATGKQTLIIIHIAIVALALVGLYKIWSEDVPIISFLNTIVLWTYHVGVDVAQNPIVKSATLGNLLMCVLILVTTYLVTKNLFGLLNILFFKRFKVEAGSQHAVTLITKYIIAVVGLSLALDSIGIGWSKFQWLIAALTVGLSFGLQEIVANFVSGIILLFERPISVGDTISVGGVEGKVTKIRIRSTTITDWDNKEVLVPNKTLFTTNITNWTLSDQIVRIVIPVGIAYGANARKAEEILLKVTNDNELTLDTPASSVIFVGFGDSSLDFKLRTYAKSSNRMSAINKLHLEINDAFNSAGLEIPFPQRDVHLDSLKPIDVNIVGKA